MTAEEFHQQQLERRRQEEEWQQLYSDPIYLKWSESLRDESEKQQSKENEQ